MCQRYLVFSLEFHSAQAALALFRIFGRITRNLSIDRWRRTRAFKRGGGQMELALEELKDCVSGAGTLENDLIRRETLGR